MKIGVLIPSRGDRTELLDFALKQIDRQSRKPDVIELVNDKPLNDDKDITLRYKIGCERLIKKGVDLIIFFEDDDYYNSTYIERIINEWEMAGKPNIFGIGETLYYHLGIKAWNNIKHPGRASAMSTVIIADAIKNIKWPKDNYIWTDIELWKQLKGSTFIPETPICIGIKGYNEGKLFGGIGHNSNWSGYKNKDSELVWLKNNVDENAFEFYKKILKK